MEKKRSRGVTIFAWIELLSGITALFNFALLIVLYIVGQYPWERICYGISNNFIEEFVFGLFFLSTGILTLKLKPRGRILSMSVYPSLYVYSVWMSFVYHQLDFSFASILGLLIGLGLCYLPIYFFTRPKVKEQFQ